MDARHGGVPLRVQWIQTMRFCQQRPVISWVPAILCMGVLMLTTACRKTACDADLLAAAWASAQPTDHIDAIRVLRDTCDVEAIKEIESAPANNTELPKALLKYWRQTCPADTDANLLRAAHQQAGIAARRALTDACPLNDSPLADKRSFNLAIGRPVLAQLLYHRLNSDGINQELATDIARTIAGPPAIPDGAGSPHIFPAALPPIQEPAQAFIDGLDTQHNTTRIVLSAGSTLATTWQAALGAEQAITWVGLAQQEGSDSHFVEFTAKRSDDAAMGAPDQLILWATADKLYIYQGSRRLLPHPDCLGAAICRAEPTTSGSQTEAAIPWAAIDIKRALAPLDTLPKSILLAGPPELPWTYILPIIEGLQDWRPESLDRLVLKRPAKPPAPVQLEVSDELQSMLALVIHHNYSGHDVTALFDAMRPLGDEYCQMTRGKRHWNKSMAMRFATGDLLKRPKHYLNKFKSGCFNYFRMNDHRPNRDFELVRALFEGQELDCYSVGMLQPFMMHNILSCSSLSFIDFDWRILDAQHQLLALYEQGAFADPAAFDDSLAQVSLSWIAKSQGRPSHPADIESMCSELMRDTCIDHIRQFQDSWFDLERAYLNISSLHDGSYVHTDATRVIYFSNASERAYTSTPQFRRLVRRLGNSLAEGQKAVMIHHTGGVSTFGIYTLVNRGGKHIVDTLCRDPYYNTGGYQKGMRVTDMPTYDIYLDNISQTRRPISCAALLRRHGIR